MKKAFDCKKTTNQEFTFEQLYSILTSAEKERQKTKAIINAQCINIDEQKRKIIIGCFDMISFVISLPFNQEKFNINAYELIGDIFTYFKDYKIAILYYKKGVNILLF